MPGTVIVVSRKANDERVAQGVEVLDGESHDLLKASLYVIPVLGQRPGHCGERLRHSNHVLGGVCGHLRRVAPGCWPVRGRVQACGWPSDQGSAAALVQPPLG